MSYQNKSNSISPKGKSPFISNALRFSDKVGITPGPADYSQQSIIMESPQKHNNIFISQVPRGFRYEKEERYIVRNPDPLKYCSMIHSMDYKFSQLNKKKQKLKENKKIKLTSISAKIRSISSSISDMAMEGQAEKKIELSLPKKKSKLSISFWDESKKITKPEQKGLQFREIQCRRLL